MLDNSFEEGDFLRAMTIDGGGVVFPNARCKLAHEFGYGFGFIVFLGTWIRVNVLVSRLDLEFRAVVTVEKFFSFSRRACT